MKELNTSFKFYGGAPSEDLRKDLHALRTLRNEMVHSNPLVNPSSHFTYQQYSQVFRQEYQDYLRIQQQKHHDRQVRSFKLKFEELVAARYSRSTTGKLFDLVLPVQGSNYEQKVVNFQSRVNQLFGVADYSPSTLQPLEASFQPLIEPITLTDDPLYLELKQALQVSGDFFKPKAFIDYVLQQLCNYVKRYFKLLKRDIRQSFRRVIQLIFKNMDDESGEEPSAPAVFGFQQYFKSLIFNYDNRTYVRSPQWAAAALPGAFRGRTPGRRRGMFATQSTGIDYSLA